MLRRSTSEKLDIFLNSLEDNRLGHNRKIKRDNRRKKENTKAHRAQKHRRASLNRGVCIDWLHMKGLVPNRSRSTPSHKIVSLLLANFPFSRPKADVEIMSRGQIISLAAEQIERQSMMNLSESQFPEASDRQHVYFVGDKDKKVVKIGIAKDVKRRCASLQSGFPAQLCILHVIKCGGDKLERLLHDRYDEYNSIGEWFFVKGELAEFLADKEPVPFQSY